MFYELRIQLVNLTKEKLSAWFKSEGNPRGEGTIFTELRSVEGKEVKTNGLFCRVYSVHTEWKIITEKKKSFYTLALWCVFYLWAITAGFFFYYYYSLLWALHPLAGPRSVPPGEKSPMAGLGQGWMTKDHCMGHRGPYFPAINKIAGGIYLDLAPGNTISGPKCTVTKPPPSLPLAYFSLGKSRIIFAGFSHTETQNWPLPPPHPHPE
uniref:Uncharacterized protein n=1 Tax=Pipistrellus kuhlii TaxID=59472 RepID=A0A7J7ZK45_PIPKU|nr:hypothetical protein mPipKuh1_009624 [Pipistrellus kuhlii]